MRLAIAGAFVALCVVIALLFWSFSHPLRLAAAPEGSAATAAEEVSLAERDVTPPNMIPGPVVEGPLTRLAVAAPPLAPPRWRRFFRPLVLEAGLIDVGHRTIRLPGIASLPANAICEAGAAAWPCGRAAITAVQRLIRGRAIECRLSATDTGDPLEVPCRIGASDLTLWLAETGWGRPDANADDAIETAAAAARRAGRGLWHGRAARDPCPKVTATDAVRRAH